jgi:glycosyltransferase involved in cell wall biosynthesis
MLFSYTSTDMATVSIVIPAYNAAKFIRAAVDSALAQTHPDREVIVVDDGSSDTTPEILASYGDRIRVVRQANQGTAVACNAGVGAARGEWVAFLDADDEWLPGKLARQLAECSRFAISHTDSVCFGDARPAEIRRSSLSPLHQGWVLPKLLISNFIVKSTVMMRRETFLELGGFAGAHDAVEDWPLWLKACAGHELGYLAEPLVRYRVHLQSKSMKARATHAAHLAILREAFGPGGVGEAHKELQRPALAASHKINSHYAAESGDWTFAVRCALKALQYEPVDVRTWKTLIKSTLIPLGVPY